MATHSSVLAWRIPRTREPGGLPSVGSHRIGHDWSDLAAASRERIGLKNIWRNHQRFYKNIKCTDLRNSLKPKQNIWNMKCIEVAFEINYNLFILKSYLHSIPILKSSEEPEVQNVDFPTVHSLSLRSWWSEGIPPYAGLSHVRFWGADW